jgi:hypothetical protein
MSSCCRPNVWLMEAMTGWKMAEVSRYDVPAQKASTDVPFSFCAMSYRCHQHCVCGFFRGNGLTGSTVTRIVASNATINDIKARLIMINHSFFVGSHISTTSIISSPLASTSISVEIGCTAFTETAWELGVDASFGELLVSSSCAAKYVSIEKPDILSLNGDFEISGS